MTQPTPQPQVTDSSTAWKQFFLRWPADMAHTGALVTSWGEQIAFREFMLTDALLLLERRTPDSIGTRQVILPYYRIDAVKITDPVDIVVFAQMGFRAPNGLSCESLEIGGSRWGCRAIYGSVGLQVGQTIGHKTYKTYVPGGTRQGA